MILRTRLECPLFDNDFISLPSIVIILINMRSYNYDYIIIIIIILAAFCCVFCVHIGVLLYLISLL